MFREPRRDDFTSYADYALAVVGYLFFVTPGSDKDSVAVDFLPTIRYLGSDTMVNREGLGRNFCSGQGSEEDVCECKRGRSVCSDGMGVTDNVAYDGGSGNSGSSVGEQFGNSEVNASGGADVDRMSGSVKLSDFACEKKKGRWYEHNKLKRQKQKEKKKNKAEKMRGDWRSGVSDACKKGEDLRITLEEKWIAENKLAKLRAERAFRAMESVSIEDNNKKEQLKVRAATERTMVSIEKTHATLRATGNVPGEVGSAETLLSTTISPDSSASLHEYRECQKKLLDSEKEVSDLKLKIEKIMAHVNLPPHLLEYAELLDRNTFTDNTYNVEAVGNMVPGDHIIGYDRFVNRDGKACFRVEIA